MEIQIPHFRRRLGNRGDRYSEFIEMNGECIHKIENVNDFYKTFGYSEKIARTGMLPDEFIWEEYIKDASLTYTECLQIHTIEYLQEHSDDFRIRYQNQAEQWIAAHAQSISARGILCATCRTKSFCSKWKVVSTS